MSEVTAGQPAYQRVAAAIRADIDGGRWAAGEQMPTEAQLAEDFSVSRNTIRQGLELLHSWNLVTRRQGSGTFVAPHGLSHAIGELKSLTDVMRERRHMCARRDAAGGCGRFSAQLGRLARQPATHRRRPAVLPDALMAS